MTEAPASHRPVLLAEVLEALEPREGARVLDGTFGAGGYSRALAEAGAEVLALDRDPSVRPFADALAAERPGRFALVERRFSELEDALDAAGWPVLDGAVFDVGVSSMQLDRPERGFSFQADGPLDMRMGPDGPTAADVVNGADETELARILYVYGEERASRRVAAALVRRRAERPFETTLDLADVVSRALGGRRGAPTHPATRTFQALRIHVNSELDELEAALEAAERRLSPGGRLAVVTFHSLEDRLVKSFLQARSGRVPGVSRHLPPSSPGAAPSFELLFSGARAAGPAEAAANPRARSAKLRAARRTAAPAHRAAA